ncbi:SDR family NAD(P)-dependent oxidoreductase [Desertimonas flava]|uniref:SDR family NAD(P)-dependent oxidoreductase n=1 Tax=Desertimonas flava TaxID=2064846 RepID=UPI000E344489|nr:SDR family oxidoreductase [Desertimonas flava]
MTGPERRPVALVTGGGTGIGAAIVRRLHRSGFRVVAGQRTDQESAAARERFAAEGLDVDIIAADLRSPAACAALVDEAIARAGALDVLVNNAAVTGPAAIAALVDADDDFVDELIDVNLKAAIRCTRHAARWMIPNGGGVVVNIASVGAYAAQRDASVYVASKAGLVGFTRGAAFDLADHGIRVIGVAPGDIALDAAGPTPAPVEPGPWWQRRTPLGRRGTPDDVAAAVGFVVSTDASFITGETITVDGGWTSY